MYLPISRTATTENVLPNIKLFRVHYQAVGGGGSHRLKFPRLVQPYAFHNWIFITTRQVFIYWCWSHGVNWEIGHWVKYIVQLVLRCRCYKTARLVWCWSRDKTLAFLISNGNRPVFEPRYVCFRRNANKADVKIGIKHLNITKKTLLILCNI